MKSNSEKYLKLSTNVSDLDSVELTSDYDFEKKFGVGLAFIELELEYKKFTSSISDFQMSDF